MSTSDQLREDLRAVRSRYDKLKRGRTASIRHCHSARELALEPVYWEIGDQVARERQDLAHVVLLFPLASQQKHISGVSFSFGRFLRRHLGDGEGAALRFRRLLASRDRDRDELDHHLRRVLRLACVDKTPVDWGVLGADILWFFGDNDHVRRRWAQDFYAPIPPAASAGAAARTPNT